MEIIWSGAHPPAIPDSLLAALSYQARVPQNVDLIWCGVCNLILRFARTDMGSREKEINASDYLWLLLLIYIYIYIYTQTHPWHMKSCALWWNTRSWELIFWRDTKGSVRTSHHAGLPVSKLRWGGLKGVCPILNSLCRKLDHRHPACTVFVYIFFSSCWQSYWCTQQQLFNWIIAWAGFGQCV